MKSRTRTALAAALVLGIAAGPAAGPALALPRSPAAVSGLPASGAEDAGGPDVAALRAALAGLPDKDVTAALVRVGGDGSWHGAAGVRDIRTGAEVLEHGRFRAGSVTKVVTAAIVLQLAAEGRVDLDASVETYLPGLLTPAFTEPVTVRQLLDFTSGLQAGGSLGDTVEEGYPHRFETLRPEEVVASAVAKGPASAPGTRQEYGNIGYTVLGMLIEEVTGDTYEHQAAVRILRPLGMRHTSFPKGSDPRVHGPHNRGYDWIDGKLVDVTEWNMSDRWAAGDMISTTADLERLLVALFEGKVVPEPQLEEFFTVPDVPGATRAAGGMERHVVSGREVWGKTGSRPGYQTVIAATRDLSRTLVYSVNSTDAKGDAMGAVQRFAFPAFAS
ncbi:MAG TPA: serine hydrolase domain-containing protein [Streptomyces sp.]|uniref:serine hydrolase domain-containing protein n=1 Tax=Streptomyces sp. TaxID=1931 RepID=UPI002D587607|nr:serine hydrolase domain-containing protein [Streptomyces sp.]HZG04118.1 serine hydrolase domain-containing protein [Streptomyces sp.]